MTTTTKEPHQLFRHYRIQDLPLPSVTVMIEEHDNKTGAWVVSWSVCSVEDNFNKATGREIANATKDVRGYRLISNKPTTNEVFADAISMLMTSQALSADREVARFRNAMQFLIRPDKPELTCKGRLHKLAFEKMNALASYILRVAN